MRVRSLRARLLAAAGVSILLALTLAGFGLVTLFEGHVERRVDRELATYLHQLVGRVELDGTGRIHITRELMDVRFDEPLSGLYWQVQDDERPTLLRSRSLWDETIALPRDRLSLGEVHRHRLPGPAGQTLLVRERQVVLEPDGRGRRLRVAVALDRGEVETARDAFAADMLPYLLVLAAALMTGTWLQVRVGLSPLEQLRKGVLAIRGGRTRQLQGGYPLEVTPLVDGINELLEARDRSVERARAWTADLAHGLKTPLAALGADAQRLRDAGHGRMADDLDQLSETMRRRVDRELIRARLRSAGPAGSGRSDVVRAVEGVARTLQRTPRGAELQWLMGLPREVPVAMDREDLMELVGNLLDNAVKWAHDSVRVRVEAGPAVRVRIGDDGPGVPREHLERLGDRGLRLDEQTQGHGLGLAIARDIVTAYGADMAFSRADLGGLEVYLTLPRG